MDLTNLFIRENKYWFLMHSNDDFIHCYVLKSNGTSLGQSTRQIVCVHNTLEYVAAAVIASPRTTSTFVVFNCINLGGQPGCTSADFIVHLLLAG